MLYVSSKEEVGFGVRFGITNTKTSRTVYYTKRDLKDLVEKHGYDGIAGLRFDGKDFIIEATNPVIEEIDKLAYGDTFKLKFKGSKKESTYTKLETIEKGWLVQSGDIQGKLMLDTVIKKEARLV